MKGKKFKVIIFHLITSIDKGGAENHLYSLIKKQVESNDNVYVIYLKGNNYWKKYYKKIGVKVFKINFENNINIFNLISVFIKIQKLILKYNPKIVHAHLSIMELIGAILKYKLRGKFRFIVTKHLDSFFLEASFGQKKIINGSNIDKFIINQSDKVICISKQVKNYFKKKIPYNNKYKLIYYGFNPQEFKNSKNIKQKLIDLKKKYKINKGEKIFCNVARHVKQKSIHVILNAFSLYLKKQKKSKLILVGKGPETVKLKIIANKLGIGKNVSWINNYENIKDIYTLSDVFILSSKYEGLGLVLLEAMDSQIPIIATNASAIPEIIINNYNGLLFRAEDHKNLALMLERIHNVKLRKKFIRNGSMFLKSKFNLNTMALLTKNVYRK